MRLTDRAGRERIKFAVPAVRGRGLRGLSPGRIGRRDAKERRAVFPVLSLLFPCSGADHFA
jgi:hypothetical protein